jgi:hypothetical protein
VRQSQPVILSRLLDSEAVEKEWSAICGALRARMLAVPSRCARRLPQLDASCGRRDRSGDQERADGGGERRGVIALRAGRIFSASLVPLCRAYGIDRARHERQTQN